MIIITIIVFKYNSVPDIRDISFVFGDLGGSMTCEVVVHRFPAPRSASAALIQTTAQVHTAEARARPIATPSGAVAPSSQ